MAKDRLSMRKFKEILRLKFDHDLTNRQIGKSCAISHVTVGKYLDLAQKAGITWPIPDDMDDAQLEHRLHANLSRTTTDKPGMPPMEYLFKEMKRKHVTLQLLWYEYKQNNPDGYQYSYFCELYQKWRKSLSISMRQEHLAGEKAFIDYAGQTVPIFNPETGKSILKHRFSSPPWVPATIRSPRQRHPRSCRIGSNPISAPLSSLAGFPKSWFRTI